MNRVVRYESPSVDGKNPVTPEIQSEELVRRSRKWKRRFVTCTYAYVTTEKMIRVVPEIGQYFPWVA